MCRYLPLVFEVSFSLLSVCLSDSSQLWKRTGAWFFKAIPNFRHPRQHQESTGQRKVSFSDSICSEIAYRKNIGWESDVCFFINKLVLNCLIFVLQETKSSNSSDYLSLSWTHKYDQTWPSFPNAGGDYSMFFALYKSACKDFFKTKIHTFV